MKIEALGLIEIKGFLGSVAAADAALKTADVTLLNVEKLKGGQTTLQLAGDVSAVTVAVESAAAVAGSLNCLISSHVIPRMAADTAQMILGNIPKTEKEPVIEETKVSINKEVSKEKEEIVSDKVDDEKSIEVKETAKEVKKAVSPQKDKSPKKETKKKKK